MEWDLHVQPTYEGFLLFYLQTIIELFSRDEKTAKFLRKTFANDGF